MSIQKDLETKLLAALKQAPRLAAIKTWEADIRDCLFTESKLTQGFNAEELPALNLSASIDPTKRTPFTYTEAQHDIPVSIVVITKAVKRKEAFDGAKDLQEAVECVLELFRRSGNSLGQNTFLFGEISSSAITIQQDPYSFAVGTTGCTITKIT
ncbi:MAG TPA: hypothetical protein VHC90_01905 [Bryobacteraceae bacterium]|nr:hypothetical protein [Bryobacteraceae bacterium]